MNVENCSDLMKSFHEELYNQCKTRFSKIVSQPGHKFLLSEATFLDPRFKKYGFGGNTALYNETKKTIERRGVAILQSKYATVARPTPAQEVSTPKSPTEGQRASTSTERTQSTQESIWDNFDKKVPQMIRNSSGTAKSKMIVEIDRYLNEPMIDRAEDPMAVSSALAEGVQMGSLLSALEASMLAIRSEISNMMAAFRATAPHPPPQIEEEGDLQYVPGNVPLVLSTFHSPLGDSPFLSEG
ncbi:hypothetical protein WDU94_010806 [Cyamophila willieti]